MATLWRYPLQQQQNAAGVAVTAAALTGSGVVPLPQLPPNYQQGARLIARATGEITSTSATPTVILGFYIGSVGQAIGSKIAIAVSATLAINVAATSWPFIMQYDGTIRTLSPTVGAINGQGVVLSGFGAAGGLSAAMTVNPIPITAALRTVSTLNTSQVNELDVGVTLSSVTGSPSVTITNIWAEISG